MKENNQAMLDVKAFCEDIAAFVASAPSGNDLDAVSAWFQELSAWYARYTEIAGKSERIYTEMLMKTIKNMPEEEYKRVKNSSTLTDQYVRGMYPMATAIFTQCSAIKTMLTTVSDNYRALLYSYRQERNMSQF